MYICLSIIKIERVTEFHCTLDNAHVVFIESHEINTCFTPVLGPGEGDSFGKTMVQPKMLDETSLLCIPSERSTRRIFV